MEKQYMTHEEVIMHPFHEKLKKRFLEIVATHNVAVWAFETLEWEVYIKSIDEYEALSEEEKFTLNTYMIAFRSLYK